MTQNQKNTFNEFSKKKHLLLSGSAGTGKTYISCYLALKELFDTNSDKTKIYIIRSAQSQKNVGFLPGKLSDKIKVYEAPYYSIFSDLLGRTDAYEYLKQKGIVEFLPTSFIRGVTYDNAIIIVDEAQNLSLHEADSVITRLGNNTKIIFAGDYKQSDLINNYEGCTIKEEFLKFQSILEEMSSFSVINFKIDDIVRSSLIKEYLIARDKLNI